MPPTHHVYCLLLSTMLDNIPPSIGNVSINWSKFSRGPPTSPGAWTTCSAMGRELRLFSLRREGFGGTQQQPYTTLRRLLREWSWLFTVVHRGRMKNNREAETKEVVQTSCKVFPEDSGAGCPDWLCSLCPWRF